MAIKTIEILNVMVFKRHWRKNNTAFRAIEERDSISDGFKLEFCDGINVLIGENGVGKTTILKMIYAATQWSVKQTDQGKTKRLVQFFSNSLKDSEALKNAENKEGYCYYKVSDGTHSFEDSLSHKGIFNYDQWLGLDIQSVFIPTTEMLSHAKGFLAMNQKYNMPFDGTQIDIIVNASLPETREIPSAMSRILDRLSVVIDGTVILENDSFYVLKKDGRKVDFSLEAEGLRKLGLLWKLIRNGLLENGSILLWDEPEANLNPELYPLVAEILLQLQENGVQVFIATHNYNFAKYLEIRRTNNEQVMFHNLYKSRNLLSDEMIKTFPEMDDSSEAIYSQSADRMDKLEYNHIMTADNKLLDEVYDCEEMTVEKVFIEENGVYSIDCKAAVWATDKMHEDYHNAGIHINDADFLIENSTHILIVEYKNACIANAKNSKAFHPMEDKKISTIIRKFYDSLHYLSLLDKNKPVWYIYILEYPNGDVTTRKRLRNRLKTELPFSLQEYIGNGKRLIERVEVLSIDEWNADSEYGNFLIKRVLR